jgi:glycosyltransferase involved in cell wall biosynthesis
MAVRARAPFGPHTRNGGRELDMKLLYLMTEPFGIGGVQSDILTLSEDLIARGHQIYVATTSGVLLDELKAKGTHHLDIDFRYSGLGGMARAGHRLRRAIVEHGIELVAPQSVRSTIACYGALRLVPFLYRVAATGKRVPIVTTIHNIHNPMHFRYAGHILQRCTDYVIFESHYERNRCLASGLSETKSAVIHSGIDTVRFVPRERDPELARRYGLDLERHKILGIVARLSEEKGHNYLLEAFAQVNKARAETRLMVIGDGPLLEPVKAQARQLGVADTVIFTGMQRNIPDYLALLDAFVLSSTRESFPLAAREAMAAGRPVVAPRIGGCPEVVDEGVTGYLFDARNVDQLRDRMLEILADGRPAQMGRAARERVERLFSRRAWVDGDERIYEAWRQARPVDVSSVPAAH